MIDKQRIAQSVYGAFNEVAKAHVKSAGYDKTVTGKIILNSPEAWETGQYTVEINGQSQTAYAPPGAKYMHNAIVYIVIPNNDASNKKQIIGQAASDPAIENILEEYDANYIQYGYNLLDQYSGGYRLPNDITLYSKDETGAGNIDDARVKEQVHTTTNLDISFNVQTEASEDFYLTDMDCVYGIYFTLVFNDGKEKEYSFTSDEFIGMPFAYPEAVQQRKVIKIEDSSNFDYIKRIELKLVNSTNKDFNVTISNLNLRGAIKESDVTTNGALIKTPQGNTFTYASNSYKIEQLNLEAKLRLNGVIYTIETGEAQYYWLRKNELITTSNEQTKEAGWENVGNTQTLALSADQELQYKNEFRLYIIYKGVTYQRDITIYNDKYKDNESLIITENNKNGHERCVTSTIPHQIDGLFARWVIKDKNDATFTDSDNIEEDGVVIKIKDDVQLDGFIKLYREYYWTVNGVERLALRSNSITINQGFLQSGTLSILGARSFLYNSSGEIMVPSSGILTLEYIDETGHIVNNWKKTEWTMPEGDTMLSIPEDENTNTPILNYIVEDHYNLSKISNNSISATITLENGSIASASIEFNFIMNGQPGTNGTGYYAVIGVKDEQNVITYPRYLNYPQQKNLSLVPRLFNVAQTDPIDAVVAYKLLTEKGIEDFTGELEELGESGYCIIQAHFTYNENKYAYAYLPIIYSHGNCLDTTIKTGSNAVLYESNGKNPQMANNTFIIEDLPIQDSYDTFNTTEGITVKRDGDIFTIIPAQEYDGMQAVQGFCFEFYVLDNGPIPGQMYEGSLYIPILFSLNRYGNTHINDWDGQSVQIKEDAGYILASTGVYGSKSSEDNSFTGVVLGEIERANGNREQGLFAYGDGIETVNIDAATGVARFGQEGKGCIKLKPGAEAVIEGGEYSEEKNSGMQINLTAPEIKWGNGNFSIDEDGKMTAKEADIEGIITATKLVINANRDSSQMLMNTTYKYANILLGQAPRLKTESDQNDYDSTTNGTPIAWGDQRPDYNSAYNIWEKATDTFTTGVTKTYVTNLTKAIGFIQGLPQTINVDLIKDDNFIFNVELVALIENNTEPITSEGLLRWRPILTTEADLWRDQGVTEQGNGKWKVEIAKTIAKEYPNGLEFVIYKNSAPLLSQSQKVTYSYNGEAGAGIYIQGNAYTTEKITDNFSNQIGLFEDSECQIRITQAEQGHAYIVQGYLFIYCGNDNETNFALFESLGRFQGEPGQNAPKPVNKQLQVYFSENPAVSLTLPESADEWPDQDNVLTTGKWYILPLGKTIPVSLTIDGKVKKVFSWTSTVTEYNDGSKIVETPVLQDTIKNLVNWCKTENTTLVDGGNIYAGTINAGMMSTDAIRSFNFGGEGTITQNEDGTITDTLKPKYIKYIEGLRKPDVFPTGSYLDLQNGEFFTPGFKNYFLEEKNESNQTERKWYSEFKGKVVSEEGEIAGWKITNKGLKNYFGTNNPILELNVDPAEKVTSILGGESAYLIKGPLIRYYDVFSSAYSGEDQYDLVGSPGVKQIDEVKIERVPINYETGNIKYTQDIESYISSSYDFQEQWKFQNDNDYDTTGLYHYTNQLSYEQSMNLLNQLGFNKYNDIHNLIYKIPNWYDKNNNPIAIIQNSPQVRGTISFDDYSNNIFNTLIVDINCYLDSDEGVIVYDSNPFSLLVDLYTSQPMSENYSFFWLADLLGTFSFSVTNIQLEATGNQRDKIEECQVIIDNNQDYKLIIKKLCQWESGSVINNENKLSMEEPELKNTVTWNQIGPEYSCSLLQDGSAYFSALSIGQLSGPSFKSKYDGDTEYIVGGKTIFKAQQFEFEASAKKDQFKFNSNIDVNGHVDAWYFSATGRSYLNFITSTGDITTNHIVGLNSSLGEEDKEYLTLNAEDFIDIQKNHRDAPVFAYGNWNFANDGSVKFEGSVSSTSGSIQQTSDARLKNSIQVLPPQFDDIFDNLQPVLFKYNAGTSNRFHSGFIVQPTNDAIEKAGWSVDNWGATCYHRDEDTWYLRYDEFIALNTDQIQKAKARIGALEKEVEQLKLLLEGGKQYE